MIRFFSMLALLALFSLSLQAAKIKVHFVNLDKSPVEGVSAKVISPHPLPPGGKVPAGGAMGGGGGMGGGDDMDGGGASGGKGGGMGGGADMGGAGGQGMGPSGLGQLAPEVNKVNKSNKRGEVQFHDLPPGKYVLVADKQGYGPIKGVVFEMSDKDQELTATLYSEATLDQLKKLQAEGNDALNQQNFSVAVDRFQEILKVLPNEAGVYAGLARAYAAQIDWEKAIPAAQKAGELDNAQFGKLGKIIQSFELYSKAQELLGKPDYPKAIDALNQAVGLDDTNPEFYYGLALAYGHQKNYAEAEKYVEQALKIKPDDDAYLNLQKVLKHNAAVGNK